MAKATSKSGSKSKAKSKPVKGPIVVLYGVPIKEATASGNLRAMKAMSAKAHKYIATLQTALAKLDAAITKAGG